MDEDLTGLVLHSQEPAIIFDGSDEVVDHHEEKGRLVIQDAGRGAVAKYVPCTEEEDVTMDTCVMSLEEDLQGDLAAEEALVEGGDGQDTCEDYLMISLDETDRVVDGDRAEEALDDHEKENKDQELIKVYIFKTDSGKHDSGGDKMTDEVYMEVMVGDGDAVAQDQPCVEPASSNPSISKERAPVAWTPTYAGAYRTESRENRNGAISGVMRGNEPNVALGTAMSGTMGVANKAGRQCGGSSSRRRVEPWQVQTVVIMGPYGEPLTVYPCVLCGKKFKSRGFLRRHILTWHQDILNKKKYQCPDCEFSTNKKASLQSHVETHKPAGKAPLAGDERSRELHQQGAPPGQRPQPSGARPQAAPRPEPKTQKREVSDVSFSQPPEPKKRVREREHASADAPEPKASSPDGSAEGRHKCDRCLQTFGEREELLRHVQTHEEARVHQCAHCEHRSSNSSDLKRHVISVHTKDYPHKCAECAKGFHRPSELKKHLALHRTKKAHQCRHCSFSAADPFVLSRHILSVHTKEPQAEKRPRRTFTGGSPAHGSGGKKGGARAPRERRVYQCQYCSYSTGDASGFKRHVISIHTKDYPHRCQVCGKGFRRPSEKNQHIMRHHRDLAATQ